MFGQRQMVAGAGRVLEQFQADWIVAEIVVEAMHQAGVRPVKIYRREFDPVALIRRGMGELLAQQRDGVVLGVGAQHVEFFRRQRRRFIGFIADGEIERRDRADQRQRRERILLRKTRREGGHRESQRPKAGADEQWRAGLRQPILGEGDAGAKRQQRRRPAGERP